MEYLKTKKSALILVLMGCLVIACGIIIYQTIYNQQDCILRDDDSSCIVTAKDLEKDRKFMDFTMRDLN